MKKIIFVLLIIVFVGACSSEYFHHQKNHYSQFKNSSFNYDWKFSETVGGGGYTYNRSYFELKQYNRVEEFDSFIWSLVGYYKNTNPPYNIQYKHEEGHILQLHILKAMPNESTEQFYNNIKNNCLSKNESVHDYYLGVIEGSADFYSINCFNNSISEDYFKFIKSKLDNKENKQFKNHYLGLLFTNFTISRKIYMDLSDFILHVCNETQYNLFQQFIKTLS